MDRISCFPTFTPFSIDDKCKTYLTTTYNVTAVQIVIYLHASLYPCYLGILDLVKMIFEIIIFNCSTVNKTINFDNI